MADELSPSDKAVFVLFDGIALALMFAGVDWLIAGKPWEPAVAFFALAFVLALIAHNWLILKPKLGKTLSGLASRIERIATDYRYRTGSLFLVAFLVGVTLLFYIGTVRRDLDLYVMPRVVTKDQADELRKALSASPSDTKVTIFSNLADSEATEYAAELSNAIRAGGWDAESAAINPWDPTPLAIERKDFAKILVVLDQGLVIQICLVGQPTNPDPKHPTPHAMLEAAFSKAHIAVNGGGSRADCGQYSLDIVVGRRPETIGQQPPILVRLGNWLAGSRR